MSTERHLRCPTCRNTSPVPTGGVIIRMRVGGHETFRTRYLKRCPVCRGYKFQLLETEGEAAMGAAPAFSAERELTLQELAAYVSEDSMDIETAEAIAGSPAPEARKREIAAHVAEGTLDRAEAVRLLAL